jgi:hypothetical protein
MKLNMAIKHYKINLFKKLIFSYMKKKGDIWELLKPKFNDQRKYTE